MKASKTVVLATGNPGKIREMQQLFSDLPGWTIQKITDFGTIPQAPEDGLTFSDNASQKALFYSQYLPPDTWILAEDSGLCVAALNDEPGVHSSRYAGPQATDADNIVKLLTSLQDQKNRQARFIAVMALVRSGRLHKLFTGELAGVICDQPRGSYGFGYDPVFYYSPFQKTIAELTPQEKNTISHRSQALTKLKNYLINL